jgi:hypothetical protein
MMGLIDERFDGQRRFGVGHFDLIIIDEAHRSVYQKYRAIFDYFDFPAGRPDCHAADEIDHNTYGLFDLEDGVPHRCLRTRRSGGRRSPGAAGRYLGAAQVPARGHQVRRPFRRGEGGVGRA